MSRARWWVSNVRLLHNSLYPAVDERGCARDFEASNPCLWDQLKGENVVVVNAADPAAQKLSLSIEFRGSGWPDIVSSQYYASFVNIHAELPGEERPTYIGGIKSFSYTYVPGNQAENQVRFTFPDINFKKLVSPRRKEQEPWAFVGKLRFSMVIYPHKDGLGSPQEIKLDDPVPIELYAICPSLPKHLRFEGVPINVLRFALGPQNRRAANKDVNEPYLEAITQRVFDSGFVYNRSNGEYAFTPGTRSFDLTQLTKYLRLWTVLNESAPDHIQGMLGPKFKEHPPMVNCMDQTGILGICMSFACVDEDDESTLGAYFVKPFGFLHDSPLVGYSTNKSGDSIKCNNPFRTKEMPKLYYPPATPFRTYFGKHVFLEFRSQIYDACAGPYLGSGNLKKYLSTAIDREEGNYPTIFRDIEKDEVVEHPNMRNYTANPDNSAKRNPLPDKHGGILGQLHDMSLDGNQWKKLSEGFHPKLDLQDFTLDIATLGNNLIEATKESAIYKIQDVSKPIVDTGSMLIDQSAASHGEVTWMLKVANTGYAGSVEVALYLRIKPAFELAAAARSSMYGDELVKDNPTTHQLTHDPIVSGISEGKTRATAIAGRFLIDCEAPWLDRRYLVEILEKILEFAKPTTGHDMVVNNKSTEKEENAEFIQMRVGERCAYVVQADYVLDVDWAYASGNVFLLDYETADRTSVAEDESLNEDDDDEDWRNVYRFKFYARNEGADKVKLVFYDRTYQAQERWIKFEVSS